MSSDIIASAPECLIPESQSLLMNLPAEVRLLIWKELFAKLKVIVRFRYLWRTRTTENSTFENMSLVSKRVNSEATPVFFQYGTFYFSHDFSAASSFSDIRVKQMRHIRGGNYFFCLVLGYYSTFFGDYSDQPSIEATSAVESTISEDVFSSCETMHIGWEHHAWDLPNNPAQLDGTYASEINMFQTVMDIPKRFEVSIDVIIYCRCCIDAEQYDATMHERFSIHSDGTCELRYVDHEGSSAFEYTVKFLGFDMEKAKEQVTRHREMRKKVIETLPVIMVTVPAAQEPDRGD